MREKARARPASEERRAIDLLLASEDDSELAFDIVRILGVWRSAYETLSMPTHVHMTDALLEECA